MRAAKEGGCKAKAAACLLSSFDLTWMANRILKVFFNASRYDKMKSEEEKSFFKFLNGESAESDLTRSIAEKVARAKVNKQWRRQYMTWQQTIDEEKEISREEGREEGARENAIENAKNALAMGLSAEQVAQITSLPLEQVLSIKR